MSIRFAIKSTAPKAEKEGDMIIRFSGTSEPFNRVSERDVKKVGQNGNNAKLIFNTGLDEKKVQFYGWYNDDEKKAVVKQIKDMRPIISEFYGGAEVMDSSNEFFWLSNRDVNRLSLSNDTIDAFYDTKNPAHALLYLSVIGGAFSDMVAPNKEWAERFQTPHYLSLETDDVYENEDDVTRSDAHAALSELRKDANPDALFILAWCIQYDTNAFGGINKQTPQRQLIQTHIQYIDGKLVSKKKRNTPKIFLDYVERWKGTQTRPALYTEAYIKAGEYFNFVNQRDKNYVTADGTTLGNTVDEAVETIMQNKYTLDLEKLRDQVENKWKE